MTGAAPVLLAGLLVAAAVLVARPPAPFGRLAAAAAGPRPSADRRPFDRRPFDRRRQHRGRGGPPPAMPAPILLDLVGSVLVGGAAPATAVTAVADCLLAVGDPAAAELFALATRLAAGLPAVPPFDPGGRSATAAPSPATGRRSAAPASASVILASALELAADTGLGPVALVRAAADEERRRYSAAQIQAARRLGVMILLPTGLCLLPAFVLLTVVPLVLDLVLG